jgi:hypothetical protein
MWFDFAETFDKSGADRSWHGDNLNRTISSDCRDGEHESDRQRLRVDVDDLEPRGGNRRLDRSRPRHQRLTSSFDLRDGDYR